MRAVAPNLARGAAVGLACLATLAAQAGQPAAAATAIRGLLDTLDAAFTRGDADGFAAPFAPDHPAAFAMLRRKLEQTFAQTSSRHRASTIVGEPRRIGEHTVVHVRADVELRGGPRALLPRTTFVEDWVLALRADAAGKLVVTLAVEATSAQGREDRFRCPACNYEIGGVPGWLCVPLRSDRAAALEAASFFLLGTDIVCDVSVQVDPEARAPAVVAQQLADALHELEPGSSLGVGGPWLPPAYALGAPQGLRGARVVVDRGADHRATFHVAAFGGLQQLLLLRGSTAALDRHERDVRALLASYQLLECDRDPATAVDEPLAHHTGGSLDGTTYRNRQFGVELAGAAGWRPAMLSGGAAFRVVWSSPGQSRMWLTGYLVPPGMNRWCRATAERWLAQQCEQRGLELLPAAPESTPWADAPDGSGSARTLVGNPRRTSPDVPYRRWFRLLLRDDLLLVADGFATTAADADALQQMLQALRRR